MGKKGGRAAASDLFVCIRKRGSGNEKKGGGWSHRGESTKGQLSFSSENMEKVGFNVF